MQKVPEAETPGTRFLHQQPDYENHQVQGESRIHFQRQFEHGISLVRRWWRAANWLTGKLAQLPFHAVSGSSGRISGSLMRR
jgi:hypothetical protein